jgi:tight adherence protein C
VSSGLAALGAVAAYVCALIGVVLIRSRGPEQRFELAEATVVGAPRESLPRRAFATLGRWGMPLATATLRSERARRRVRRRIDSAGRPMGIVTLDDYARRKGAFMIAGGAVGLYMLISGSPLGALAGFAFGYLWVDVLLDGKGRRRQARIDRDLPDFLDVLSVCINAGIAFRPAMARVADAIGGPVAEEVQTALRQIALGAPRREAFDGLRERNTSEALGTFVSAFLQAEELGVPLADALVELARDMRRDAAQRARRRAQNAVPRVSLVVVVTILPAAVLLLLASLLLNVNVSGGLGT